MDNRPIGVFDSGVGGLSAIRRLEAVAPGESFAYFGDTARVPYGDRQPEDIKNLSRQDARFLRTRGVKALVIACNTITANAMPEIQADDTAVPVVGVIQAAAEAAVKATKTGRIGVIATNATVASGVYEKAVTALLPPAEVTAKGCPKLVPLIETGHITPADGELMPVLREYLAPLQAADVDTVILGCTHYPLIAGAVGLIMGDGVSLIDSGAAGVDAALQLLCERDALSGKAEGEHRYYCSARKDDFTAVARAFLGHGIEEFTEVIDIDKF